MSAATLQLLIESGVSGDRLVAIVASIDADAAAQRGSDPAAEKRRAWDRERKRSAKSTGIPHGNSTGIPPENGLNSHVCASAHAVAAPFEEIVVKGDKKEITTSDEVVVNGATTAKVARVQTADQTALVRYVAEAWNTFAGGLGLPQVAEIHTARRSGILARAADLVEVHDFADPRSGFQGLFNKIRGSPWLCGQRPDREGRPFRCTLDFAIKKSSFTNIMEGKYEDRQEYRKGR